MTWQGIKEICGLTKGKDNLQGKYATWRLLRNTVLANLVNQAFQAVTETIDRKWYIHCNKISTSFSSRSLHHWCPEGRKTNSENQYQESCRAWCYTQLAPQGCQCLQSVECQHQRWVRKSADVVTLPRVTPPTTVHKDLGLISLTPVLWSISRTYPQNIVSPHSNNQTCMLWYCKRDIMYLLSSMCHNGSDLSKDWLNGAHFYISCIITYTSMFLFKFTLFCGIII